MQIQKEVQSIRSRIFEIKSEEEFNAIALEIFQFQYKYIPVYQKFVDALNRKPEEIRRVKDIPFMPIEFFKNHRIIPEHLDVAIEFTSSGTTGGKTSTHYVHDLDLYKESYSRSFESFYGDQKEYAILALLPAYLEREGSSLVWMVDQMIKQSHFKDSGFFLHNHEALVEQLKYFSVIGKKVILFGVTFALLDLIERYQIFIPQLNVVETGGMKGRRKEMLRDDLHQKLCNGFGVKSIHSEYGMTELLSQAWSQGDGLFRCPAWMKILIREANDPFRFAPNGKSGGVNVIDLANLYSCSFIATSDLGKQFEDGSFEILGRFDQSDIRGCNLLVV